jgi:hypothetical protein
MGKDWGEGKEGRGNSSFCEGVRFHLGNPKFRELNEATFWYLGAEGSWAQRMTGSVAFLNSAI